MSLGRGVEYCTYPWGILCVCVKGGVILFESSTKSSSPPASIKWLFLNECNQQSSHVYWGLRFVCTLEIQVLEIL